MKKIFKKLLNLLGYSIIDKDFAKLANKNYKLLIFSGINEYFKNVNYSFYESSKSQLLQDYFVASFFKFKEGGTFIEFGATNGITDSNTFLLESKFAWNGVLVEPIISFYNKLRLNRKSKTLNNVVYHESNKSILFQESIFPELSTIKGYGDSDDHNRKGNIASEYNIDTITLNEIFEKYFNDKTVDYLSIDTEGSEYDILNSFNFEKNKIKIITVEHNYSKQRNKIFRLLTKNRYKRVLTHISRWDDFYILEE